MKSQNYIEEVIRNNQFKNQFETIEELEEENFKSGFTSMDSSYKMGRDKELNFSGYSSDYNTVKKSNTSNKIENGFGDIPEDNIDVDYLKLENKKTNKNFKEKISYSKDGKNINEKNNINYHKITKPKFKFQEKKSKGKNKKKNVNKRRIYSERNCHKKSKFKITDSFFNIKNLHNSNTTKHVFEKIPKKISFSQDKISKHHLKNYQIRDLGLGNISINLDKIKELDKLKKKSIKKEHDKSLKKSINKGSDKSLRKSAFKESDGGKKNMKKTNSKNKI